MTSNLARRPIVVGIDGSTSALNAARWAADEASRRDVSLRLVYGLNLSVLSFTGMASPPQSFFDDLESEGRRHLADAQTAIGASHPEVAIETEIKMIDPIPLLIEESASAGLVVLGSRGLGGFHGILVGSAAVTVVAGGHCPVAVIRGLTADETSPTEGPVVVGVDGSAADEPVLAAAFDEASARGTDLIAVHTWIDLGSANAYTRARRFVSDWDDIETRQRALLAERLAGWQEKYPDVKVEQVLADDRPVPCLLKYAAEAQLLVVGSRGHGCLSGMLLSSTSQALIYHATCPLLVVHPAESD